MTSRASLMGFLMRFNPATTQALTQLMLGGLPTGNQSLALQCRVRYFDPARRRDSGTIEEIFIW